MDTSWKLLNEPLSLTLFGFVSDRAIPEFGEENIPVSMNGKLLGYSYEITGLYLSREVLEEIRASAQELLMTASEIETVEAALASMSPYFRVIRGMDDFVWYISWEDPS